jgi:hypothetical protein
LNKIRSRKRSLLPESRCRATNGGRAALGAGSYEPRIVSECYSLSSTVRSSSIALHQPTDKSRFKETVRTTPAQLLLAACAPNAGVVAE